jgi:hypothetical protein
MCISSMASHASMSKLALLILNSAVAMCSPKEPVFEPSFLRNGNTCSLTIASALFPGSWLQCDQRSSCLGKSGSNFWPRFFAARSASCSRSSSCLRKSRNESCSIASRGLERPPLHSLSQRLSTCERSFGSASITIRQKALPLSEQAPSPVRVKRAALPRCDRTRQVAANRTGHSR